MMFGGGMMLGFGILMMALVFGLPILLIGVVVAMMVGLVGRRTGPPVFPLPMPAAPTSGPTTPSARYCSHCGQGLQTGWTHCPKCGAPVEG